MGTYKLDPVSFDGDTSLVFNGATYHCYFDVEGDPLSSYAQSPVLAEIARDFPNLVGTQPEGKTFVEKIEVRNLEQANIDALKAKYAPSDRTLKYLVVADGNGVQRRVAVVALQLVQIEDETPFGFAAVLWAPEPVWEKVTETNQTTNVTTSPQTISNGSTIADGSDIVEPTVILKPKAYKANTATWRTLNEIVVANRSPQPLVDVNGNPYPVLLRDFDARTRILANTLHPAGYDVALFVNDTRKPVYLANYGTGWGDDTPVNDASISSLSGTASRYAQRFRLPGLTDVETNTVDRIDVMLKELGSITGTFKIEIRNDSNGSPGTLVATSNTVNASVLTANYAWVTFSFSSNPVLSAMTWYWLVVHPDTLSGLDANNKLVIGRSGLQGGYEGLLAPTKVSHDGGSTYTQAAQELIGNVFHFRAFVTGNAKIWAPLPMPKGIKLTAAFAMSGGSALKIAEYEGHARLPDRGAYVIDAECIVYDGKAGTDELVTKKAGARGTAQVNHDTGAPVYFLPMRVQLLSNWYDPSAIPFPSAYRRVGESPVIDGRQSTQTSFRFGGPYFAFGDETRPMAIRRDLDTSLPNYATVSLDANKSNDRLRIRFKDAEAAGEFINRNVASMFFPPGIKAVAAAITLDATPIPSSLALQHVARRDRDEIIATHRTSDAGTGKQLTLGERAYRYLIRAVNQTIIGAEASGGTDVPVTSASPKAMSFTLDEDATIDAIAFRIKESGTPPVQNLAIDLYAQNDDGSVDSSVKLMPTQTVTPSDTTASFATITKALSTAIKLIAGKYAFVFTTTDVDGYLLQASDGSVFAGGEARTGGAEVLTIDPDYDAHSDGTTKTDAGTELQITGTASSPTIRAAVRYPLDDFPDNATVSDIKMRFVVTTDGNAGDFVVGEYGGTDSDGTIDPALDDAATLKTRALANPAYSGSGELNALGTYTITFNVNAADAYTKLKNAKSLVNRISYGLRSDIGTNATSAIAALEHASEEPCKLIITFTRADSAAYAAKLPQDIWFRVYGSMEEAEIPVQSGDVADVDTIIVTLDDTQTPLVIVGGDQDVYPLDATIAANGKTVDVLALMQINEELTLDFAARKVTSTDDDRADASMPAALESFDEEQPFILLPGSNTVTYTEPGVGNLDFTFKYRERFL